MKLFTRLFTNSASKFGSVAETKNALPSIASHLPPHGERHIILTSRFYKGAIAFWSFVAALYGQHVYFTSPETENGPKRIHPITKWIIDERIKEDDRVDRLKKTVEEAHQQAELNIFYSTEMTRPTKNGNFDGKLLHTREWGFNPSAVDVNHVEGLDKLKWRKGYGEDEDSIQVLNEIIQKEKEKKK